MQSGQSPSDPGGGPAIRLVGDAWAELEAASESGRRGEGIRVDDIDAFVDEIERTA